LIKGALSRYDIIYDFCRIKKSKKKVSRNCATLKSDILNYSNSTFIYKNKLYQGKAPLFIDLVKQR